MRKSTLVTALTLALPLFAGLPVGAQAQDQEEGASSGGLEEITVTARRREENLQDVPVSIQAVSGNEMEMRGIERVEDVIAAAPNVMVSGGPSTGFANFAMRGIPRAGFFVDEVWQQSTVALAQRSVMELDRVEILRGPQGTLYGRDTTGGAIRLYTKERSRHPMLPRRDRTDGASVHTYQFPSRRQVESPLTPCDRIPPWTRSRDSHCKQPGNRK